MSKYFIANDFTWLEVDEILMIDIWTIIIEYDICLINFIYQTRNEHVIENIVACFFITMQTIAGYLKISFLFWF